MRLNCSLDHEFHTAVNNFKTHLTNRGYTNCHREGLFSSLPIRQDLLTQSVKPAVKGILFITTFTAEVVFNLVV